MVDFSVSSGDFSSWAFGLGYHCFYLRFRPFSIDPKKNFWRRRSRRLKPLETRNLCCVLAFVLVQSIIVYLWVSNHWSARCKYCNVFCASKLKTMSLKRLHVVRTLYRSSQIGEESSSYLWVLTLALTPLNFIIAVSSASKRIFFQLKMKGIMQISPYYDYAVFELSGLVAAGAIPLLYQTVISFSIQILFCLLLFGCEQNIRRDRSISKWFRIGLQIQPLSDYWFVLDQVLRVILRASILICLRVTMAFPWLVLKPWHFDLQW